MSKIDETLKNIMETISAVGLFTDYGKSDPQLGSCEPPCAGANGNKVPANDDFYARGDSRIPVSIYGGKPKKRKTKKKKTVKEDFNFLDQLGIEAQSDFNYPVEFHLDDDIDELLEKIKHSSRNMVGEMGETDQSRTNVWTNTQIKNRLSEYLNSFDDRSERSNFSNIHTAIWEPQYKEKDYHSPLQLKLKIYPYSESDIMTYSKEYDFE